LFKKRSISYFQYAQVYLPELWGVSLPCDVHRPTGATANESRKTTSKIKRFVRFLSIPIFQKRPVFFRQTLRQGALPVMVRPHEGEIEPRIIRRLHNWTMLPASKQSQRLLAAPIHGPLTRTLKYI
jgi:hypothetical protein